MQGLQLEAPRTGHLVQPSVRSQLAPSASATLLDTLQSLRDLQSDLLHLARSVPHAQLSSGDGPSPGAIRVRRARQAAAIQGAVHVLQELLREQEYLGHPIPAGG